MITAINDLKSGDILLQDIVMPSGRTLMNDGMQLTDSMIELLKKRNFENIDVQPCIVKSSDVDCVFTSEVLINQTMKDFHAYVQSRDDYYELIS